MFLQPQILQHTKHLERPSDGIYALQSAAPDFCARISK
jgi:hypothetical protein